VAKRQVYNSQVLIQSVCTTYVVHKAPGGTSGDKRSKDRYAWVEERFKMKKSKSYSRQK